MEHYIVSSETRSEKVEMWRPNVLGLENPHSASVCVTGPPPADSAVSNSNQFDSSVHSCCALKPFDWGIRYVAEFTGLLTQSHRLQFLYWVAIHRSRDQTIPTMERLSCPLFWCRMSFNEYETLVDHVSTCSHLDQGEYWCPYHQQAEQFAQPVLNRLHVYASQNSRRPSWKAAVKAIRRLGSKGLQRAIHPSRSRKSQSHGWHDHKSDTNARNRGNIYELMPEVQLLELDGQESGKSALNAKNIHEVAGTYLQFEMEDTSISVSELDSETLSCPSMDWESTGNTTPDSSLSPISPISPGDEWLRQTFEPWDSPISSAERNYTVPWASDKTLLIEDATATMVHQSPSVSCCLQVSEKKEHFTYPNSIHIDTSDTETTVFMWSNETKRDEQHHSLIHQTVDAQVATHDDEQYVGVGANGALYHSGISTSAKDTTVPKPSRHVEDLQDIFHIVFGETLQKLLQPPVSQYAMTLINLRPSPAMLLETGFETLRKILNNDNNLSFWEVFGLSHLAYASAILSNPADLKQEFRQIFIDIIQLSSQIVGAEDKAAFIQLAHELWFPETYPAGSIASSDEVVLHLNAEVAGPSSETTSFATMMPLTLAQTSIDTSTCRDRASAHSSKGDLLEFSEPKGSMTSCRAIRHCLQNLEFFEHAKSELRNLLSTPAEGLKNPELKTFRDFRQNRVMRRYITEPLIQEISLEGFMPITIKIDKMLQDIKHVGLRELELELLNDGKHCAKSQVLYERFTRLVMFLCDRATMIIGGVLQTRKEYYLQDIDQILYEYRSLQQRGSERSEQAQDQNQGLAARVLVTRSITEDFGQEELYMTSKETHIYHPLEPTLFGNSPAPASSGFCEPRGNNQHGHILELPELDSDSQTDLVGHSPTREAEASTSTREPSVQIGEVSEGSRTCVDCGKIFRGKTVWLQSNLKRHMREKHSDAAQFVCDFPRCGKGFMRNHNLKVHAKTVHGGA
ncbi:hypothetical protein MMC26_000877 [Xylographa opegraphella]|nr:hypothetical protein [Xylographa opegraphella]